MDRSIRILHVDDDPDSSDPAAEFPAREDERFVVETGQSAAALDGLLDDRTAYTVGCDCFKMFATPGWRVSSVTYSRQYYDRVVSDYRMLEMAGSEEIAAEALTPTRRATSRRGRPTPTNT